LGKERQRALSQRHQKQKVRAGENVSLGFFFWSKQLCFKGKALSVAGRYVGAEALAS